METVAHPTTKLSRTSFKKFAPRYEKARKFMSMNGVVRFLRSREETWARAEGVVNGKATRMMRFCHEWRVGIGLGGRGKMGNVWFFDVGFEFGMMGWLWFC